MRTILPLLLCVCSCAPAGASRASRPASQEQEASRYVVDDNLRAKVRALAGDQAVADLETVYAAASKREPLDSSEKRKVYDPSTAVACVEEYLKAMAAEKKNAEDDRARAFHNCNYACKTEANSFMSPLREIGARYAPACLAQKLGDQAPEHLARFDRALGEMNSAQGALNRHYTMAKLRGSLKQAQEGLGPDDERITSRKAALSDLEQRYGAELKRASEFLARPDVAELLRDIDTTKAEIADLQQSGMFPRKLEDRKTNLRRQEAKFEFLLKESGL